MALSTVRDFEKGRRTPIANNINALERAFVAAGVRLEFDEEGNAAGIRVEMPT